MEREILEIRCISLNRKHNNKTSHSRQRNGLLHHLHPQFASDIDSEASSSYASTEDLSKDTTARNGDALKYIHSDELAPIPEANEKDEQLTEHRKQSVQLHKKLGEIFTTQSSIELENLKQQNADETKADNDEKKKTSKETINGEVMISVL